MKRLVTCAAVAAVAVAVLAADKKKAIDGIEDEVKDGKLIITTHDVWRNKVLSVREFEKRI